MIAWLKRHHVLHSWGMWEQRTLTMTPYAGSLPMPELSFKQLHQIRRCAVCGKTKTEAI